MSQSIISPNFPHLRELHLYYDFESYDEVAEDGFNVVTNFSLLSNLRRLSLGFEEEFKNAEILEDLGLFSNLIYLHLTTDQKRGESFNR